MRETSAAALYDDDFSTFNVFLQGGHVTIAVGTIMLNFVCHASEIFFAMLAYCTS